MYAEIDLYAFIEGLYTYTFQAQNVYDDGVSDLRVHL